MTMDPSKDVDIIWNKLGRYGRYQLIQFVILLVDVWPCAFHILSIVFIGYRPPFECKHPQNTSVLPDKLYTTVDGEPFEFEYGECSVAAYRNISGNWTNLGTQTCGNGYNYSVPKDRTFVTEFDLVCEREPLGDLAQTFLMLGQAFGAAIFTPMADRYGRKIIHIASHIGLFAVCLGTSFAPNYTFFAILRFITGGIQQGAGLTDAILYLEMFPREVRAYGECMGLLFWTTGCILVAPVGYLLRNVSWRYMQIALSMFSVYSLFEYWFIDESLRWLIANGKLKQARKIVKKACKMNKVDNADLLAILDKYEMKTYSKTPENDGFDVLLHEETSMVPKWSDSEQNSPIFKKGEIEVLPKTLPCVKTKKYTPLDMLKNKHILMTSIICWYIWMVNSLTYYGLYMISSELAGNRFLNYFLSAIVEYPACALEFIFINRIGRKKTCIMFHAVAAMSLITASILLIFNENNYSAGIASTVFTLLGKMAITGSFSTIFLYTPELYPTNLRNAGIGMASSSARIGGMLAPFSTTLARYAIWAPGAIFGGLCLIVTFLVTLLPETMGLELPQTIEELNDWYEGKHKNKEKNPISGTTKVNKAGRLRPGDIIRTNLHNPS